MSQEKAICNFHCKVKVIICDTSLLLLMYETSFKFTGLQNWSCLYVCMSTCYQIGWADFVFSRWDRGNMWLFCITRKDTQSLGLNTCIKNIHVLRYLTGPWQKLLTQFFLRSLMKWIIWLFIYFLFEPPSLTLRP